MTRDGRTPLRVWLWVALLAATLTHAGNAQPPAPEPATHLERLETRVRKLEEIGDLQKIEARLDLIEASLASLRGRVGADEYAGRVGARARDLDARVQRLEQARPLPELSPTRLESRVSRLESQLSRIRSEVQRLR